MNRYATQRQPGSTLVRALRHLRQQLLRPRGLNRLGSLTRVARPFTFVHGERISIGDRVLIGRNTLMQPIVRYLDQSFSPELVVGDDCYIGPDCQFHCVNGISLGRGCVLSDQVYVSDVGHGLDPRAGLIMDQPVHSKGPVRIADGCFIGFGSVVLSGVQLGQHCVVGARSVVTKSFPAYTMLSGNPARQIGSFDVSTGRWTRVHDRRDESPAS